MMKILGTTNGDRDGLSRDIDSFIWAMTIKCYVVAITISEAIMIDPTKKTMIIQCRVSINART
jgi:hypothetical protein